jgi:hypothetical protein
MGRKIILRREGENAGQILEEIQAHDEAQLQEPLKENPDLLPIEEYELSGPLMVIGRETALPSGSVDLICLTRTGELLLIEFKTGPKNPDFRHTWHNCLITDLISGGWITKCLRKPSLEVISRAIVARRVPQPGKKLPSKPELRLSG